MRNPTSVMTLATFVVLCSLSAFDRSLLGQESEMSVPERIPVFATAKISDGQIHLEADPKGPEMMIIGVQKMVEQAFTVMVPVEVKEKKDGKEVTRVVMQPQARTRTMPVTRLQPQHSVTANLDKFRYQLVSGEEIPDDEIADRIRTKSRVVVLQPGKQLDEYFRNILRDDVLVIQSKIPESK